MKRFLYVSTLVLLAFAAGIGTTFAASTYPWTHSADDITMMRGDDVISTSWGNDNINLGPADESSSSSGQAPRVDIISFYKGDAQLIFHDGVVDPNISNSPTDDVYMEYVEDTEDLTVHAARDFIVRLGN